MRKARLLAAVLCAAVLFCGLIPAYAAPAPADEEGGATGGLNWEGLDPANPLTPSGTGRVVDNATDAEGKEFYTITTEDGAVFYLVIDRQKSGENVYFLNAVTVEDLLALAESSGKTITAPVEPTPTTAPTTTPEPEATPTAPAPDEPVAPAQPGVTVNYALLLGAVAVVALGGMAGWLIKSRRSKAARAAEVEDYPSDGPEDYEAEDFGEDPGWGGEDD